jgi:hypothetical protein
MLAVARHKAPFVRWVESGLAGVDLGRTFDGIVMAGNVMIFLSPGTEGAVVANMARHLEDGGLLIAGFSLTEHRLALSTYDGLAADAGLEPAERWATWDRRPFAPGGEYAVSIHRKT